MKKVLITGASGFVGSHLIDHLLAKGEFDIYGTFRSREPQGDSEHLHFLRADLQNKDEVSILLEKTTPDFIYHLAAQPHVAESFKDPLGTITNNIAGQLHILDALRNSGSKARTLIVSTSEIYGMVKGSDLPLDENTQLRPASPYAVSKIAQDYLALQYALSYKLDILRVRPFNHIGPRQSEKFVVGSFAKQIADIEKKKIDPVMKVGNLDAKRDFTDVRDIVKGYLQLMEKGESSEAYNIGSGVSRNISDVLAKLLSFSDVKITTEQDPNLLRPSDTPDIRADITKISNLTGWKPEIPFEETLMDTLEYWRKVV